MADKFRYRRLNTDPVVVTPKSATVIEIGDLIYMDGGYPYPASSLTDQGSEALNQDKFQSMFLGVAAQRSKSGDTDPIRVATRGEFEFDCASASFDLGALVGPSENTGGTALLDQTVKAATAATRAIGRVAAATTSKTYANVRIHSAIMAGPMTEAAYTDEPSSSGP